MPAQFVLLSLGTLDLRDAGGQPVASILSQPRRAAILAYLAIARPPGFHRRDTLLALFWPESEERPARDLLNTNLSRLRASLGTDTVLSRGNEEVGLERSRLWCDVDAFEAAIEEGRAEAALDLYRGDLLEGFHISDAPDFERWLDAERQRLRELAADAAWRSAEERLNRGDAHATRHFAERAVTLLPDSETGLRRAVSLLERAGDRAAALRLYQRLTQRLRQEYDVDPAPETQRLIERVRERHDPAGPALFSEAASDPLPSDAEHRTEASTGADEGAPPPVGLRPLQPQRPARGWAALLRQMAPRHVIAAAAVLIIVALLPSLFLNRDGAAPAEIEHVAIFPFVIRGGEDAEYLREGMVDLLAAKLDGVGTLHVVNPRAVLNRVDAGRALTLERARRAAGDLGAGLVVLGSATQVGGKLQLDAALFDGRTGGRPLARATVEGEAGDIFALVDRLARGLLASRFDAPEQRLSRISAETTHSVEALRLYLEGERRFRAGDFDGAGEAFRSATLLDERFALAHYRLSTAAAWAGDDSVARGAAARALSLAERVPENEARLIQGWNAYLSGRGDEAEQIYRTVVTSRPSDIEAWYRLAEVLFHYGPTYGTPLSEAGMAFQRVVQLEPDHVVSLVHLARIAAQNRKLERLDTLVARLETVGAAESELLEVRVLRAVLRRDAGKETELREALSHADAQLSESIARSAIAFAGDLHAPRRLGVQLGAPIGSHRWVIQRLLLAHLALARGRWSEADAHLDDLAAVDPAFGLETRIMLATRPFLPLDERELRALRRAWADRPQPGGGYAEPGEIAMQPPWTGDYARGLVDSALGDHEAAGEAARRLEQIVAVNPASRQDSMLVALHQQLARLLRARVLASKGDAAGALETLGPVRLLALRILPDITQHPHAAERFLRAILLKQLGRDEEALRWFASIPDPSGYDVVYLAPSHFHRAEIHEKRGERERAVEHYARVVELWRDADPELQGMVRSARSRLQRLGSM